MTTNKSILRQFFDDPEQNENIEKLKKSLLAYAALKGEEDGKENKPLTEAQYKALIHNYITVQIQQELEENHKRHQPVSGIVVAQQSKNQADETAQAIRMDVNDARFTIGRLQIQVDTMDKPLHPKWYRYAEYGVVGAFGLFEGVVFYDALTAAGFSQTITWISTIGITIMSAVAAKGAAGFIRKSLTRNQYRIRLALVGAVGLGISLALGSMRAGMYNDIPSVGLQTNAISLSPENDVSAYSLASLSFIVFIVAVGFAMRLWKSKEEKTKEHLYYKVCDEITALSKRVAENEGRINGVKQAALNDSALALARFEFAISVEYKLLSIAKEVQQKYIEKVLRFRSDGIIPTFFIQPTSFSFTTFFEKLKK
jgi:hypothetical protein